MTEMHEPRIEAEETGPDGIGRVDVVVVGGGLAGFAAAATAARDGARVVLVEARETVGGRARSDEVDGFVVNHGAHALYRAGAGMAVLRDLGVRPQGGLPRQRGAAWWIDGGRVSMRHLGAAGGLDGVRALRRVALPGRRRADARDRSMAEWLDRHVPDAGRDAAEMLVRTACYAADLTTLDARAALRQVASAARGVLYLDGGWRSLVVGLESAARRHGATVVHGRVESVQETGAGVAVTLRDGRVIVAGSVILAAGGPAQADALLGGASPLVSRWAAQARPILAACLDVAVAQSPRRRPVATYGLGLPVYAVDHAVSADIAPDGGAVHHALFYEPDHLPGVDHRSVMEAMLDAQDPGWRDRAVGVTFRRSSVVAHDRIRPRLASGDVPGVRVDDLAHVLLAGDWLTGHGMLADASLGSGAEAGRLAAAVTADAGRTAASTGRPVAVTG